MSCSVFFCRYVNSVDSICSRCARTRYIAASRQFDMREIPRLRSKYIKPQAYRVADTDPETDGIEGGKTVAACCAIVQSTKTGEKVKPDYSFAN